MRPLFKFVASTVAASAGPFLLVLGVGFLFPEFVPWRIAELAMKAGAITSLFLSIYLLSRLKFSTASKIFLSGVSLGLCWLGLTGEIIMQKECGSPRGNLINFQRQLAEDSRLGACP